MDDLIVIGGVYRVCEDSKDEYRVVAFEGGVALLQVHFEGKIIGYYVAYGVGLVDEMIVWKTCQYFACHKPPATLKLNEAFTKACKRYLGLEVVFLVQEDNDASNQITVHSTYKGASEEIQRLIDGDAALREIASEYGKDDLTAEDVIEGALEDLPLDRFIQFREITLDEGRELDA